MTINVEDMTPTFKDDDSAYDEKEAYVLGYSLSRLENPLQVMMIYTIDLHIYTVKLANISKICRREYL